MESLQDSSIKLPPPVVSCPMISFTTFRIDGQRASSELVHRLTFASVPSRAACSNDIGLAADCVDTLIRAAALRAPPTPDRE